jgi:hypothetical protein
VGVALRIAFPAAGDLKLVLTSPSGRSVVLAANRGGGGGGFGAGRGCGGQLTVFDDRYGTRVQEGTAPFLESPYRPEQPLARFRGDQAAGVWRLTIDDERGRYKGVLRCWQLTLSRNVVEHRVSRRGGIVADVSFRESNFVVSRVRLRITRAGRTGLDASLAEINCRGCPNRGMLLVGDASRPTIRDLDADGEPEVFLNLYWSGAHCCWWTRIYNYSEARARYVPRNHWWGEARAFYGFRGSLRDLDGDGRPEFSGRDDRFMALSYFAVDPIRIWSYRAGVMHEVTRRHPKQVARDARDLWGFYREARRERWTRELLAAWAADQYLLEHSAIADRALARAARRGELEGKSMWERPRSGREWIRVLKRFLRKTGYVRP